MKEKLEQIKAEAVAQIQAADAPEKLNDVRVKYLGKKGELTAVLKGMKDVAPEDRPKVGQMVLRHCWMSQRQKWSAPSASRR